MDDLYKWPEGKRCAVMLSVLYDDGLDAMAKAPDLAYRSKSRSVWEYGSQRGLERLLSTIEEYKVPSTWFVPGMVLSTQQSLIKEIAQANTEVAARGVNFENYFDLSLAEQISKLKQTQEIFEDTLDTQLKGFRLPSGLWPYGFDHTLTEFGFSWTSSLNGDDCPYTHLSGLVQIPVHIELEDRPYFQFNFTPAFPTGHSRIAGYEAVLDNWKREFDAYRQYGLCFVLQLRPEITGTAGRIFLVREMLSYMSQFDDVWFATGSDIASWHQQNNGVAAQDHPINVFEQYLSEGKDV
ncbi:polysaccharide deacetylase family protein [Marinomonas sp. C2222]|uniref:Polysaccharide deacetylase family protein n=1 Tax=Marinomonas sargassi TaxID=2984494 RepID=A0ABT2YUJ7_9GAMM|nr:polysaccharide deacetylase family protein [Marinomonas sargassi]MCV2403575.1 polysaccharide deacetylase family protein [Marinomonas sargassi]